MNRFRELKQRLIKSKRDSQKVQINPTNQLEAQHQHSIGTLFATNYELQQWVQNQLQYYGINPSSYRLRQLKHFFNHHESKSRTEQDLINQQPQGQIQMRIEKQIQLKNNIPCQSISQEQQQQNMLSQQQSTTIKQQHKQQQSLSKIKTTTQQQRSIKQQLEKVNLDTYQQKLSAKRITNQQILQTQKIPQSNKIIRKKQRNNQTQSLNQILQLQSKSMNSPKEVDQDNIQIRDFILNCQSTNQVKQLDYYTLILQLTVQLNYSRVNRQTNNEKSILKQLKNLICYIQGEQSKLHASPIKKHTRSPLPLSSQKSCHTFSSIHSNTSLMSISNQQDFASNDHYYEPNKNVMIDIDIDELANRNNQQQYKLAMQLLNVTDNKCQINQCVQCEEEHNQTFKSISIFQQQNQQLTPQRNNNIVNNDNIQINNDNYQQQQNIILIEQSDNDQINNIIENTPLSRITEHQSQYTMSYQQSMKDSKLSEKFSIGKQSNKYQNTYNECDHQQLSPTDSYGNTKYASSVDLQHSLSQLHTKTIQLPPQCSMTNKSRSKQATNSTQFLPQNELILKKLSHKQQDSTQPHQNPLQQSLQYKRILYMLDSQYCDFKARTPSRRNILHSPSPSLPFNATSSQKSLSLYYIKNSTDLSAKSFNKEILDSNSQMENHYHHTHAINQHCLMDNLQAIFKQQPAKYLKSPERLMFISNQNTPLQSERFKKHQRSKTSLISSNQNLNKTKKYRLNLLSQLSQQIHQQSQQNAYDINKYLQSKNQSQDDSVYHKVSRNSYLTSSSPNSKVTSSESEFESGISIIKKQNLIVKKNKPKTNKNQTQFNQKKISLIVKKPKNNQNKQVNNLNNTQRQSKPNKQNYKPSSSDIESNLSSCQRKQTASKQKFDSNDHNSSQNNSNTNNDLLSDIDILTQQIDSNLSNNESKVSETCPRPIKYKVYTREQTQRGKQDKRKVLEDIVSILNSKYNKNIQLRE